MRERESEREMKCAKRSYICQRGHAAHVTLRPMSATANPIWFASKPPKSFDISIWCHNFYHNFDVIRLCLVLGEKDFFFLFNLFSLLFIISLYS